MYDCCGFSSISCRTSFQKEGLSHMHEEQENKQKGFPPHTGTKIK